MSDDDDDNQSMDTGQVPYNRLDPAVAYIHGACLVFLDGLGAGKCLYNILTHYNTMPLFDA